LPEWRNWQTHGTQNPASFTGYEGSTPSSGTKPHKPVAGLIEVAKPRTVFSPIILAPDAARYSARNVMEGSTRAARQAGTPQAMADTAAAKAITPR
jgi:hypothetical protein